MPLQDANSNQMVIGKVCNIHILSLTTQPQDSNVVNSLVKTFRVLNVVGLLSTAFYKIICSSNEEDSNDLSMLTNISCLIVRLVHMESGLAPHFVKSLRDRTNFYILLLSRNKATELFQTLPILHIPSPS